MEKLTNVFYGNDELCKVLTNSVICEHLCHAYLFYGEGGIGKRTLALRFAAQILCTDANDKKPCLSCRSCKKLISKSHPDVTFYGDDDEKSGKNSIHIEEIRELRQDAYILPNESRYKIYIIQNAQNMTIAAANAFLKLLEEPPKHAIFILTAVSKTAVFETVLSRCIPFELFALSFEEEKAALDEIFPEIDKQTKLSAIAFSNGVLGKAIAFLNDDKSSELFEKIKSAVKAITLHDEYALLTAIHAANSSKQQMLDFIFGMISFLRETSLIKLGSKQNGEDDMAVEASRRLTQEALNHMIEVLMEAEKAIGGNINMGLLENNISVELMKCI